jgi:hypothetical protein
MKKLPLGFCLLLAACSPQKVIVNNASAFNSHPQPYRIYSIGKWDQQYSIYTLIDARNKFFTIKADYNKVLKKGDVYIPAN